MQTTGINCEYLKGSVCEKESSMAGATVNTTERACLVCLKETTRTNRVTASLALYVLNPYGIDAFLISEEVMLLLPDVGFVIGVSVWDYWILWHMMTERFRIKAKTTPGLPHLRHTQNWGDRETELGLSIMRSEYGMEDPKQLLDAVIPKVTKRLQPFMKAGNRF